MKDDPSILSDRETVELLSADPELLAIADAVRATQRKGTRTWARPRLLLLAAALVALSAMFAFAFEGASGGHRAAFSARDAQTGLFVPTQVRGRDWRDAARPGCPLGSRACYEYGALTSGLEYTFTRTDGAISSIALTVHGPAAGGTAEVRIVRGDDPWKLVVFSEQVRLTPAAPVGPTGFVPDSEWSGTLSPSAWDGGCEDAPYWIEANPTPADETNAAWSVSYRFDCMRRAAPTAGATGASGPTGGVGPTRGVGPTS